MKKINYLFFLDDDFATNHYHKLIVEDSEVCHRYEIYDSPFEALEYFKKEAKKDNPDLPDYLFLDINMPELTGWEFLEEYNKLNIKKSPVVIMLTTSLSPNDQAKAEKFEEVKAFENKPLKTEYLEKLRDEGL